MKEYRFSARTRALIRDADIGVMLDWAREKGFFRGTWEFLYYRRKARCVGKINARVRKEYRMAERRWRGRHDWMRS